MRWIVVLLVMAGVINPACGCGEVLGSDCHTVAVICEHADEHSEEPCDHDHGAEHTQPRTGSQPTLKVPPVTVQDLSPVAEFFTVADLFSALFENTQIRLAARELNADDLLSSWPPLKRHCALLL